MSALLTRETALKALNIIKPAITSTLTLSGLTKTQHLYIAVLDPTMRWHPEADIEDAILVSEDYRIGPPWQYSYDVIAQAKAMVSWRTGKPSGLVRDFAPHLYLPGEIKYRGSWVTEGIVTTASGVQPYFDEMFSKWLGATCVALATHAMQAILQDEDRDFI